MASWRPVKKLLLSRWPYHLVRIILGLIFVYAGAVKLTDPKAFARALSAYDLLPEGLLPVAALGLPGLEVLLGLGLILERRGSLAAISLLLAVFALGLGYGLLNDLNIDCGCFSLEEIMGKNSLKVAFLRDLLFIGAAAFLFWSRRERAQLNTGLRN